MDSPVAVNKLGHSEVDALSDDCVRLRLADVVRGHHEAARRQISVHHGLVDIRHVEDLRGVLLKRLEVVALCEGVDYPRVGRLAEREVERLHPRLAELAGLGERNLKLARDRRLDASAVHLGIALRHMRIAHRKKSTSNLHLVMHGRADADALVVEVAASRHRRDRVDAVVRRRREAHAAHVHVHRDLCLKRIEHVADWRDLGPAHVGDGRREALEVVRHARTRILDVVALDAVGVGDGGPAELVGERRVQLAALRVDLVDGNGLVVLPGRVGEGAGGEGRAVSLGRARLVAPPGGRVRAVGLALSVEPRLQVEDLDRDDVAGLRVLDVDRPREHVDAVAGAGGAAARDALNRRGPLEDTLHAFVALDHLVVVVAGVMRCHLDDDGRSGADGQTWLL
mmetsp:Transcript_831/g.1565  ORF Transcript_831/g.1565 Transcript_831/m.1565 type:complete len:397 (-) Transcript_831:113-1303(-)